MKSPAVNHSIVLMKHKHTINAIELTNIAEDRRKSIFIAISIFIQFNSNEVKSEKINQIVSKKSFFLFKFTVNKSEFVIIIFRLFFFSDILCMYVFRCFEESNEPKTKFNASKKCFHHETDHELMPNAFKIIIAFATK